MSDTVRSRAESTEQRTERSAVASPPAGLDSARAAAYGPQSYGGLQYQQPSYDNSVPSDSQQILQGHAAVIDCNLGDLFANTFNSALDKEENSMIAAPIVGPILGVGDVFIAAKGAASTINDIAQDIYGTYTSDDSAQYSQKLYQDIDKIAGGLQIVSAAANHAWDVAAQHDSGVTNAGYANPETYKQIATDTARFAGAVGDAFSNLSPSEQILGAERLAASLLFTHHVNWAAGRVGEAIKEIDVQSIINKVQLPELTIVETATAEGPSVGNVLFSKKFGPNKEGFETGRAGVGETFEHGQEALLASTVENVLKPEQYEAILKRSIDAQKIAPEDGLKIADALKNRLKEDFPKIQRQNLAFAIVYTDGEPQMVYSFKGVDYPGPKADLNHYPSFPVNARYTDSEHRILVDLDKKMTGGFVDEQQKILLYSEQMPCEESCTTAMLRFILEHDETEIKVSYSFKDLDERREAGR